jgi:hypothetical protein
MSNANLFGRRTVAQPKLPRGDVVGTYDTYPEAQRIVDRLAKAEFEVSKVSIVGNDLKTVERVTGRLTYGRAALAGAASGAWFGVFFGLLILLVYPVTNLAFFGAAALIGAGFGMLFSLIAYAINRRTHDFTSMTQVLASSYQVIVDPDLADKAHAVLARPEHSTEA